MIGIIVSENLKKIYTKYILGLLLCSMRKNCTQMAQSLSESHDVLQRALSQISKDQEGIQKGLIQAAYKLLNPHQKWWLIIDDTMLIKPHIKKLKEAILDRCGATGRVEKGVVAIFIAITDGQTTIPLGYKFWINKKNSSSESYRKKWEIGIDLLKEIVDEINCKNLLIDGAYINRFTIPELIKLGFEFEGRFRKNGKVVIDGEQKKINEYFPPLLFGPRLYWTMKSKWQGIELHLTAHKHVDKDRQIIITYTVSNREASASQHAKDYLLRWGVEKFFRTAKQSLGIHHCASRSINMHSAHINACLIAYVFLQAYRIKFKHASVENTLKLIRHASLTSVSYALDASDLLRNAFA